MKYRQNLHTHTTFCDGKDTPEELIEAAIAKGFDSIGFSGHSYMFYAPDHSMSIAGTEQYRAEISRLKLKYAGVIDIYLGLEFDLYSLVSLEGYDYIIGSVHYLRFGNEYVGFDRDAGTVKDIINRCFDGDGMAFAREYYHTLAELPRYGKFDVVGHFDLITKHIEHERLFDTGSKEYLGYAVEAIDSISDKIPFYEVNTGAIARGYRTSPYPSAPLLRELKARGCRLILSSDCHNKDKLDCEFDSSLELLREIGFREIYVLTKKGFDGILL